MDDIFQEVFLKYLLHSDPFESKEHEKAWLCRVAFNQCKDFHKSFWQRKVGSIEEMEIPYESPEQYRQTQEAVMYNFDKDCEDDREMLREDPYAEYPDFPKECRMTDMAQMDMVYC